MTIELKRLGDCALLTLNRPEALNALSFDIIRQIDVALDDVASQKDVRALLVTGQGEKAFCAGADITELLDRTLMAQKQGAELGQAVFAKLSRLRVPSIALVNGYAFGGGCELALACTFRLAAPNSIFGLPEIKLGLVPGYGGIARLPKLVGEGRALEIIMTGRNVQADEAERIGLVNSVVTGDLIETGLSFAASVTRYSIPVLQIAREAIKRTAQSPLEEALRIESDASTLAYQLEDSREGMTAFLEKRKPQFMDL
ncbi:enoyl-CoA hydratase [Falsochrobactrum shanghaiense]|uniref:Enoyl-CoA hydratase n=1 Tax=Falsochrobactrum shanghaiense TaxID=2201899 RepID=A0A316J3H2_9HYPH|nr:enoyl-CoA hydratase-related protein [Falsochrobactrum shanghaiense]PWL16482.1 enoyl-CoA hydratase [Falsochrobactrum shanghaiense]